MSIPFHSTRSAAAAAWANDDALLEPAYDIVHPRLSDTTVLPYGLSVMEYYKY